MPSPRPLPYCQSHCRAQLSPNHRRSSRCRAAPLSTIVGIIIQPLPFGAAMLSRTLTFIAAFSAFGDPIPSLTAFGFFFACEFVKTGLTSRVSAFGSSSLSLNYLFIFTKLLHGPAIPSVSTRVSGILCPHRRQAARAPAMAPSAAWGHES